MKRIHIVGNTGSGKSTISKHLAESLSIPHYQMDDIYFEKKYSVERPHDQKVEMAKEISLSNAWISEGVQMNFTQDLFRSADIVFHVSTNKYICLYRIIKRHIQDLMKGKWYVWDGFHIILKYAVNPPDYLEFIKENSKRHVSVRTKEEALKYILEKRKGVSDN
jgi:adenylate kinase family enzyme